MAGGGAGQRGIPAGLGSHGWEAGAQAGLCCGTRTPWGLIQAVHVHQQCACGPAMCTSGSLEQLAHCVHGGGCVVALAVEAAQAAMEGAGSMPCERSKRHLLDKWAQQGSQAYQYIQAQTAPACYEQVMACRSSAPQELHQVGRCVLVQVLQARVLIACSTNAARTVPMLTRRQ